MGIGVGTPVRLADLLDAGKFHTKCRDISALSDPAVAITGALKLDNLKNIVIDGSHIDQKKRGIFDMKETFRPMLQLLNREEIRARYGKQEEKIQILVF